jgi:ADP-glucose pyrophosphorylase
MMVFVVAQASASKDSFLSAVSSYAEDESDMDYGVEAVDSSSFCRPITCCAYVNTGPGHCVRTNTIPAYMEMNRQMTKLIEQKIASTAEISTKTQVGPDSMVGDGSKVGDRCSVKKSVIGSHCTIGKNVKIVNSVIMDYVIVEDKYVVV